MKQDNIYCHLCRNKLTEEIHSTLCIPFFYCGFCKKIFYSVLEELNDEYFNQFSNPEERKKSVQQLGEFNIVKNSLNIQKAKELGLM